MSILYRKRARTCDDHDLQARAQGSGLAKVSAGNFSASVLTIYQPKDQQSSGGAANSVRCQLNLERFTLSK